MWKTSQGDRILEGSEANLVREILGHVWRSFQTEVGEAGITTGVELFDDLQRNQQLAMLLHVGESLLVTHETPELSAVREATVYALFKCLYAAIMDEIQVEAFTGAPCRIWRQQALTTRMEIDKRLGYEEASEVPPVGSDDSECWEFLSECLADEILWDRDFEMGYLVEDEDPDNAQVLKQILDIGDNYYTHVSPDPTDDELIDIHRGLSRICPQPR